MFLPIRIIYIKYIYFRMHENNLFGAGVVTLYTKVYIYLFEYIYLNISI